MYDVRWVETAVLRLADFWTRANAERREEITAAAHRVDNTLQVSPLDAGESRDDGRRIFIDLPLVVIYEVDVDTRVVTVLDAVVSERRGPIR